MLHYKHILLTTDCTPEGQKVADQAKEIADAAGAKLTMVHVLEFNPMMYGGGEFAIPLDASLEDTLEQQALEFLNKEGKRLELPEEQCVLVSGTPKDEIMRMARTLDIDLVVVGGHDQHGLQLLFGSTANAILHHLPCDILAVRLDD